MIIVIRMFYLFFKSTTGINYFSHSYISVSFNSVEFETTPHTIRQQKKKRTSEQVTFAFILQRNKKMLHFQV